MSQIKIWFDFDFWMILTSSCSYSCFGRPLLFSRKHPRRLPTKLHEVMAFRGGPRNSRQRGPKKFQENSQTLTTPLHPTPPKQNAYLNGEILLQSYNLRWFLRKKHVVEGFSWNFPCSFPTNPCFENYNEKDTSPCLFKRYNGPILPHWCLYWY